MTRKIRLDDDDFEIFGELSYPATKESAVSYFEDVVLLLPDRNVEVGNAIAELQSDSFASSDELEMEFLRKVATETAEQFGDEVTDN